MTLKPKPHPFEVHVGDRFLARFSNLYAAVDHAVFHKKAARVFDPQRQIIYDHTECRRIQIERRRAQGLLVI